MLKVENIVEWEKENKVWWEEKMNDIDKLKCMREKEKKIGKNEMCCKGSIKVDKKKIGERGIVKEKSRDLENEIFKGIIKVESKRKKKLMIKWYKKDIGGRKKKESGLK